MMTNSENMKLDNLLKYVGAKHVDKDTVFVAQSNPILDIPNIKPQIFKVTFIALDMFETCLQKSTTE